MPSPSCLLSSSERAGLPRQSNPEQGLLSWVIITTDLCCPSAQPSAALTPAACSARSRLGRGTEQNPSLSSSGVGEGFFSYSSGSSGQSLVPEAVQALIRLALALVHSLHDCLKRIL